MLVLGFVLALLYLLEPKNNKLKNRLNSTVEFYLKNSRNFYLKVRCTTSKNILFLNWNFVSVNYEPQYIRGSCSVPRALNK